MQYDMVFEGGGAKGMIFVGALQVLEAAGHTHARLLGTSAGAITATLLAAGYTAAEMLEALAEQRDGQSVFADFMGTPAAPDPEELQKGAIRTLFRTMNIPFIPDKLEERLDDSVVQWLGNQSALRHLFAFVDRGGWYSADAFVAWMSQRLDSGTFNGTPRNFSQQTLAQFHAATGANLTLIATDTTAEQLLILNHQTAPDVPVVWATRMSMSIPLLWEEVVWRAEWGTYRGKAQTGHTIVDGGILSNFPLELFVSGDEMITSVMGTNRGDAVIGLLIDESAAPDPSAVTEAPAATGFSIGSLQTVQRFGKLINTMLGARDKYVIESFERLVVRLPAKGYGTTEFNMTPERRGLLVQAGANITQRYLEYLASPSTLSFDPQESVRTAEAADKMAKRLFE